MHKQENSILNHLFPPKAVSKPDPETGYFNPWPNFKYTGTLRPVYPLSPRRPVPDHIPRPDYAEDGIPKAGRSLVRSNKIEILDAKSIEGMRKVCRLAREVLDIAAAALRPGITTDEIDEIVHNACIERNVRLIPAALTPCVFLANSRDRRILPL
jgi:Methionine aminopeptidase